MAIKKKRLFNRFKKTAKNAETVEHTDKQRAEIEAAKAKFLADVEHILYQKTTDDMIAGIQYERERLYEKYVSKIDEYDICTDNWISYVNRLLSFLRISHLDAVIKASDANEESAVETRESNK